MPRQERMWPKMQNRSQKWKSEKTIVTIDNFLLKIYGKKHATEIIYIQFIEISL